MHPTSDRFILDTLEEAYPRLDSFFGIEVRTKVFIVPDRKTIDKLQKKQTPAWLVGWTTEEGIYVLDRHNHEEESSHKYVEEEYKALVIHELVHSYTGKYSGTLQRVRWLWEGLAIYLSGQLKFRKRPEKIDLTILTVKDHPNIYKHSGWFVKDLLDKHGKEKILGLLDAVREGDFKEKLKALKEDPTSL